MEDLDQLREAFGAVADDSQGMGAYSDEDSNEGKQNGADSIPARDLGRVLENLVSFLMRT